MFNTHRNLRLILLVVLAMLTTVSCASTKTATPVTTQNSATATPGVPSSSIDPYEKFNRHMFTFNEQLDKYILKPIATVYVAIVPKPLNQGIHNFFNNLDTLPTIGNDILQFNIYQAVNDMWRFGINTTIGIGGLFDVATRMNLPPYTNDFGLTLAKWGYKTSNYVVLPFFGPNTVRDGIELPVDYYAFTVYPYIHPTGTRYAIYSVSVVDRRAQLLQYQSVLEEVALDKYVFIRNAYMQRRAYQIQQTDHRSYGDQFQQALAPRPIS